MVPEDQEPYEDQEVAADESAEDPPKPRRRSRAVLRGARIRRRASMTRTLMSLILFVAVAGALGWAVAGYFRGNPRYRLTGIELRGAKHLGKSEVEAVFKTDEGRGIYTIPLDERRRQIEEISWVHHAAVTRVLPGEIWVHVEEREPVAFLWSPRGVSLIDGEGVVLDTPPETFFSLPVVRGVTRNENEKSRREKLQRLVNFLAAIRAAAPDGIEQISEVNLADPRNLRAIVSQRDQSVLLHLGEELFGERFLIYRAHIGEWRRQFTEMQSIDLRYEGQAVIHSGGEQSVRVDSPGTKPAQGSPPLKSTQPARAEAAAPSTPTSAGSAAPSVTIPQIPLVQEAGLIPAIRQ